MHSLCLWTAWLMFAVLSAILYNKVVLSCVGGQEYECESKVLAEHGAPCVQGCNSTITEALSPGSCVRRCCSACYRDCKVCSYVVVATIRVLNKTWNPDFAKANSPAFKDLDREIRTAFATVFNASGLRKTSTQLLEVNPVSGQSDGIQVVIRITSSNATNERRGISILNKLAREGRIGSLRVKSNSLTILNNPDNTASSHGKKSSRIDVVEISVTCLAAVIILCTVITVLYHLCTTPSQRSCKCMSNCRRNQVH